MDESVVSCYGCGIWLHKREEKGNSSRNVLFKKIKYTVHFTEKLLGKAMVESVACYGCEVCLLKRE